MQDRYAGDIGDYLKLALLRRLSTGKSLTVVWYLTPDEMHNGDGGHVSYLLKHEENRWRWIDPPLYDHLRDMVMNGRRCVASLQPVFPIGTRFHSQILAAPAQRRAWFEQVTASCNGADIVFADPDNGIAPPGFKPTRKRSIKSITLDELRALGRKTVVVYHHHSRFKGGHAAEIESLGRQIYRRFNGESSVCAIRFPSRSPRVFFIVHATPDEWQTAEQFAASLGDLASFHAITGPPEESRLPPENPYSFAAERRAEAYAERLERGEYDHVYGKRRPANGPA
jgi:hypothetical protein